MEGGMKDSAKRGCAERKGWSMTWLVLLVAVLAVLPSLVVSQFVIVLPLCLFFAGLGLARRRFTPAVATVAVVTLTICISPFGEAMFDPRSYEPQEVFTYPAEVREAIEERVRNGEPIDAGLLRELRDKRVPAGMGVNRGIYVLVALVGLAYVTVAVGAGVGIRRARNR